MIEIGLILTIVFIVMKCLGHLSWSWGWVFSPLWIAAIATAILLFAGVGIISWWIRD